MKLTNDMKARIKATGEIIEVSQGIYSPYQYVDDNGTIYTEEQLEILQEVLAPTIDYWTRLEHQYAGMAMQAMLTSPELMQVVTSAKELLTNDYAKRVAVVADRYAHALVEELKEKEERK